MSVRVANTTSNRPADITANAIQLRIPSFGLTAHGGTVRVILIPVFFECRDKAFLFFHFLASWPVAQTAVMSNAKIRASRGRLNPDLTQHLERPGSPFDHRLAGLVVVADHGAVRIRDVAKRAPGRDVENSASA
jgi:hypothetical protein